MQQANEFVIAMVKSTIARELEDLEPDPGQRLGLMAIIAIGLFSDLRRGSRGARLRRGRQQPACSVRPRVAVALSRVIRPPALPAIASRCVPRCRPLRPTHPTAASLIHSSKLQQFDDARKASPCSTVPSPILVLVSSTLIAPEFNNSRSSGRAPRLVRTRRHWYRA